MVNSCYRTDVHMRKTEICSRRFTKNFSLGRTLIKKSFILNFSLIKNTFSDLNSILNNKLSPLSPVFKFSTIQHDDLLKVINRVKSKAKGYDGLSSDHLLLVVSAISGFLLKLFNKSLSLGEFPEPWKKTLIFALSKSNSLMSISDTRPIAHLCAVSKYLERLVHQQLTTFIYQNNILSERQAGYRPGYNTQSVLLELTEDIKWGIENQMVIVLLLFDLSKAFDTVPHARLLRKLRSLNFDDTSIKWFHSYLAGRTQSVIDNQGGHSHWKKTTSGVPQGSVLGPYLFLLYMNDLPTVIKHSKILMFVDDTQLYIQCHPSHLKSCIDKLTQDANSFAAWVNSNGLSINLVKTKAIILGENSLVSSIDFNTCPKIAIDNCFIEYVTSVKNLGVMFDSTLSWKNHVSKIVSRCYSTLFSLKIHRHSLSIDLRTKLVQTLIFPHFDYACVVYHFLSKEQNNRLVLAFNSCIRFIFRIPKYSHITSYRKQLNWLTVDNRRLYFVANLMYYILNNKSPTFLANRFIYSKDVSLESTDDISTLRRSLRNPDQETLYVQVCSSVTFYHSFSIGGARFWNSIPTSITKKRRLSINTFKTEIYNYLMSLPS